MRRRLQKACLQGRIARTVSLVRINNFQKKKNFALAHKDCCGAEQEKSSETKINLFGNDTERKVCRPKGLEFDSRYTKKTIKHGYVPRIMVRSCFFWYGVTPIHRIEQTMDRFVYKKFVQECHPILCQQDNDPKHFDSL